MKPLLSINIPTYNRLPLLRVALAALIPQVCEEVELNVTDNHSTDGTWEYLATLEGMVNRFRPPAPIEPNYNILSCASLGRGTYCWIHCDDDVAMLNGAANVIRAVKDFDFPPVLTFQWVGVDAGQPGFVNSTVAALWRRCDRDQFLRMVSYQFTFASAIIVKRDCVDVEYIKTHSPIYLVPANIIFSTAGRFNDVLVSEKRLLTSRGGSGTANRLTIFSRDVWRLFQMNRELGYNPAVLRQVYRESLSTVLVDATLNYGVTWKGTWDVARYSWRYKEFYLQLLPLLAERLLPPWLMRLVRRTHSILVIARTSLRRLTRRVLTLVGVGYGHA